MAVCSAFTISRSRSYTLYMETMLEYGSSYELEEEKGDSMPGSFYTHVPTLSVNCFLLLSH